MIKLYWMSIDKTTTSAIEATTANGTRTCVRCVDYEVFQQFTEWITHCSMFGRRRNTHTHKHNKSHNFESCGLKGGAQIDERPK